MILDMHEAALPVIEYDRLYIWYARQKKKQVLKYGKNNYDFQFELSQNFKRVHGGHIVFPHPMKKKLVPKLTVCSDTCLKVLEKMHLLYPGEVKEFML